MSTTTRSARLDISLVVNDTCEYDLSATFDNHAGATCRIAPSSLRITNNEVNLVVELDSCTTTSTPDEPADEAVPLKIDDSDDGDNPLNARLEFVTSAEGDRVTWSPPPASASATISHYLVRYSRPAIGDIPPWQSRLYRTTSTSHTSPNLRYSTTYTVAVTSVNHDNAASSTSTTEGTTSARASLDR